MTDKSLHNIAQTMIASGTSIKRVARTLHQKHQPTVADLAAALKPHIRPVVSRRKRSMAAGVDHTVADATYLAQLLVESISNVTPLEVAEALKDPRNYPSLTALQLGTVLKADGVFPDISASEMQIVLSTVTCNNAPCYTADEVEAAMNELYPSPPPPPPAYRREGPAGQVITGALPFDGTDGANGRSITKLVIRSGNIVDGIQVGYGQPPELQAPHGGSGGGGKHVTLDAGDVLTGISGYWGRWFGGNYILQLTFTTRNGKKYGPYGDMAYSNSRNAFSLDVNAGEEIVAFFGAGAYGNNRKSIYLGSLGIVIKS
jgi:hypothetical protein